MALAMEALLLYAVKTSPIKRDCSILHREERPKRRLDMRWSSLGQKGDVAVLGRDVFERRFGIGTFEQLNGPSVGEEEATPDYFRLHFRSTNTTFDNKRREENISLDGDERYVVSTCCTGLMSPLHQCR